MSTAAFVRPDGKEKVTGAGRYTADLTLTGQLHAKLRYADHTHARIVRIDTTKARALPGVLAVLTHEDVPDVRYGVMVKDRRLFAKERVRFEADVIAAVAALTPELAAEGAALIEVEYEQLPAISDVEAASADGAPLIHEDWASYESSDELGRDGNVLGYSTIVKGDAAAALAAADVVVKGRYLVDCLAGRSDRAPGDPRGMARRPRDGLVVDAGAVRRAERSRRRPPDPRVTRARDRPAPRRRVRLQVRLSFRGSRRSARASGGPAGEARLHAGGGVRRARSSSRGDGDRARERRSRGRNDRRPSRQARSRRRCVLRRGWLLRPDGGDACLRSVRARERGRLVDARLHEQPTVGLDPRTDRAAGLLGARAAHGRAGRSPGARSARAAAAHTPRATAPSARPGRSSGRWGSSKRSSAPSS